MVPAARYIFTHDADVALCGALAGKPGVIVIAGTGSMAFGRNAEGNTARAGGWGYVFGDEGGGFDLARQALRAALRHEEAWGPKTALRGLLLEATGASDAHELMHRFYARGISKAKMAALAPLVDRAAVGGDGIAQDILKSAAQTLAMFAGAVRAQLFPRGESVAVSYGGGVFRSPVVLARCRMLVELEDGNRVTEPVYGPAAGALLEAYRAAGVTCMLKNVPREKV
jgi:N-acetylglucosamine kinase-like BadF-type ATPase